MRYEDLIALYKKNPAMQRNIEASFDDTISKFASKEAVQIQNIEQEYKKISFWQRELEQRECASVVPSLQKMSE